MLSRLAWRLNSVPIGLLNRRMFHQSIRCMDKDETIESNNFPSTVQKKDTDSMAMIKSARNSYEFLNFISENVKHFSAEETIVALKTLFELQKHTNTSINQKDIVRNSDFEKLCRSLKSNARHMELNDVIDALKITSFIGIQANSEITMSLLNLIKYQINDVSLGHIAFLSYLLRKMEASPLVCALQMALPMLLQVQISAKLDDENLAQLTELLHFVSENRVNDACILNIVSALTLHGDNLNSEQARSIVWSLSSSKLRIQKEYCDKLLGNAISAMVRNVDKDGKMEFSSIVTTVDKMISKYLNDPQKFEKFYDETFFNKCADWVVKNDFGFENATFLQRQLSKLNFVHIKMLKYMLHESEKYPGLIIECRPISLIALVTALSQANYKPERWDKIQELILRSNLLTKDRRTNLPWVKLSLELFSLGIECTTIWDRVFNDQFLRENVTHKGSLGLLRILELYQNVKVMTDYNVDTRINEEYLIEAKRLLHSKVEHPMQVYLESAFGGPSFVWTKVVTRVGQIIDHVIAFDKETMEPARIDGSVNNNNVFYEDIATDKSSKQYIAVVSFPSHAYCRNIPILKATNELKLRTYEKMGITTVVINQTMWNKLLDHEKIPYIQREVRLKLTQLQNVLQ